MRRTTGVRRGYIAALALTLVAGGGAALAAPYTSQGIPSFFPSQVTMAGGLKMTGSRFQETFGANVASANDLTLGSDGNTFVITGTTQINALTYTNWQDGAEIQLLFLSVITLKTNTTGGANTYPMQLAGGVDATTSTLFMIRLVLAGTNWIEESRNTPPPNTTTRTIMTGYSAARVLAPFGSQYVDSTAVIQGAVLTWGVTGSVTGNVTVAISCGGGASQSCTSPCNTVAGTAVKCTFGSPVDVLAGSGSQVCVIALTDNCSVAAPTLISVSAWGHY